jgi:hypothetical protein
MKHISNYNDFLNENETILSTIVLDSPCVSENPKYKYRWVLKINVNPLKSVLKVEQQFTSGEWSGTPGQWFVGTLLNKDGFGGDSRVYDTISIHFGQNWNVSGLVDALKEVENILNLD